MRQTSVRVIAAVLMTGAIATAMGLPRLFDPAREPRRAVTAPPSSLERAVPAPAAAAWLQRSAGARANHGATGRGARGHTARPAADGSTPVDSETAGLAGADSRAARAGRGSAPKPGRPPAPAPAPSGGPPSTTTTTTTTTTTPTTPVPTAQSTTTPAAPPANPPPTSPPAEGQDETRPGWGNGDKNHTHTGPPGKSP